MSGKFQIEYGNDKMGNEMEMEMAVAVGVLKLFWLIKSYYRLIEGADCYRMIKIGLIKLAYSSLDCFI